MDSAKIVMQDFYKHISEAEAILVGAGSGMSAAAGFRHYYERDKDFIEFCGDFEKKYGYHNSFDGFYYPYRTSEERWAFISRMICMILEAKTRKPYYDIFEILKTKIYLTGETFRLLVSLKACKNLNFVVRLNEKICEEIYHLYIFTHIY